MSDVFCNVAKRKKNYVNITFKCNRKQFVHEEKKKIQIIQINFEMINNNTSVFSYPFKLNV